MYVVADKKGLVNDLLWKACVRAGAGERCRRGVARRMDARAWTSPASILPT